MVDELMGYIPCFFFTHYHLKCITVYGTAKRSLALNTLQLSLKLSLTCRRVCVGEGGADF